MATPLPTFNVSDAQLQKIVTIFGSKDGYLDWLRGEITRTVTQHEIQSREAARLAEDEATRTGMWNALDDRVLDPVIGIVGGLL